MKPTNPQQNSRRSLVTHFAATRLLTVIPLVLTSIAFCTPIAKAEGPIGGDLFSQITMSQTTAAPKSSSSSSVSTANEILGVVSLSKLLTAQRIDNQVQSQSVVVLVSDLASDLAGVADSTRIRISVDAEAKRIDVRLPVLVANSATTIDGTQMFAAMNKLSELQNVHLTASDNTVSLHTSIRNQDITADSIRAVSDRLTQSAQIVSQFKLSRTSQTKTPPSNTKPVQARPTTPAPRSVVGTWSAKSSATDAWAVRLSDDKTFVMVHTRNGKNAISRGSYQVANAKLVLSESGGVTLTGKLNQPSATKFDWQLIDSNDKPLTTLAFTKQP